MDRRLKSQCIFIETAFDAATMALEMNNERRKGCAGGGEFDSLATLDQRPFGRAPLAVDGP